MDTLPLPLVATIATHMGTRDFCCFARSSRICFQAVKAVIASRPFSLIQAKNDDAYTRQKRLFWASKKGLEHIVDVLITVGGVKLDNALQDASHNGHLEVVNRLLEDGADVHAENDLALRWASQHGHLAVVERLLAAGADVHAYYDDALRGASENGHLKVVKRLLAADANLHEKYSLQSYHRFSSILGTLGHLFVCGMWWCLRRLRPLRL